MEKLSSERYEKLVNKFREAINYMQGFEGGRYLKKGDGYIILDRTPGDKNVFSEAMKDAASSLGLKPEILFLDNKEPYESFESFPDKVKSIFRNKKPKAGAGLFYYGRKRGFMQKEQPARFELVYDEMVRKTKTSWLHSPGITLEMAEGPIQCNYKELNEQARSVLELLEGVYAIDIKAKGGTNLGIEIPEGVMFDTDCDAVPPDVHGKPGKMVNLPPGEVFLSKYEDSRVVDRETNKISNRLKPVISSRSYPVKLTGRGVVYCDICTLWTGEVDPRKPFIVRFGDGVVDTKVPDIHSKDLRYRKILKYWEEAENRYGSPPVLNKFGIGLNRRARIKRGRANILVAEKSDITAHVGVGAVGYKQIFVFSEPTIEVEYKDGTSRVIMEKGNLNLEL